MVAFTALLLFIIGLFNCVKLSVKWDKFVCGVSLSALFVVILYFSDRMLEIKEHIFSFLWNSSPSGDIRIDIVSNTYNCELFFPFLIMGFLGIGANYCFRFEEKRCRFNALMLFNLASLLLMITSNNFVQLLVALFFIDIFAVALADNANACRRFIIINLFADMLIFMILALINGRIDSLDIRQVINYKNMGYHLNFIAIIGFTAILMKLGFFPFQTNLLSLKDVRTHRLQNILCLFSPISAIILLLKFNKLWQSSEYFLLYFDIACPLTLVWCAFRATLENNLRAKIIDWQIMFFALLFELLRFHGFVWDWRISDLLLANNVLIYGIYLLYYHAGRKKLLSDIIGLQYESNRGRFLALGVISVAIISQINILEMLYNNRNRYYIWIYACLFLFSFSGVIHQILFAERIKNTAFNRVIHKPLHSLFLLLMSIISVLLLVQLNWESLVFWSIFGVFVALTLSGITSHFSRFYTHEQLQKIDWFKNLYDNFFLDILQHIGRLFWLVIDWKLVEKVITGAALALWQAGLRCFKNVQKNTFRQILFVIIVLSALLWFSPYFSEVYQ